MRYTYGVGQGPPFELAESAFAALFEDLRDGAALACLDQIVQVEEAPVKACGQHLTDGRLARSHEADESNCFWDRRLQRRSILVLHHVNVETSFS